MSETNSKKTPDSAQNFRLLISADRLRVRLGCRIRAEGVTALKELLALEIQKRRFAKEALKVDVAQWIDLQVLAGHKVAHVLLCEGRAPLPAAQGRLEWAREFLKAGFHVDPKTGLADYRRPLADRQVHQGEILARIVPPVPGQNGCDVFGKEIRVPKPARAILKPGPNTALGADGTIRATVSGRVRVGYELVAVDHLLVIKEDVGLRTGHIRHQGALHIQGDIQRGSQLDVEGDIEVDGHIECCTIRTKGQLIAHGGVTGDKLGGKPLAIEAGGNVSARYVSEAEIHCGGSLTVEREIVNCRVTAAGAVTVPRGRIVGGEISAFAGVQAQQAGSEAEVRTTFVIGDDPNMDARMAEYHRRLSELNASEARIQTSLYPLKKVAELLPPEKKETCQKLSKLLEEVTDQIADLNAEIEAVHGEHKARRKCELAVLGLLHKGVEVRMEKLALKVPSAMRGPLVVRPGLKGLEMADPNPSPEAVTSR